MKKRYWLGLGVLAVVGGGFVILPQLVSVEKAKALVAGQVKEHTGRDLVMAGKAEVGLFPTVAIRLEQVSLSSPEGFGKEPMLDIPVLTTSFALLPLVRGELQLKDFTLEKPVVRLEKKANGKANWAFESPTADKLEDAAEAKEADADSEDQAEGREAVSQLKKMQLGDIRIQDATLYYKDGTTGKNETLDQLNVTVKAPDLASALSAEISTHYRGKEVTLELDSDSPLALLQGGKLPLTLDIRLPDAAIAFKGDALLPDGQPQVQGGLEVNVGNLPALLGWISPESAPSDQMPKQLVMKTRLQADQHQASLTECVLDSDRLKAKGMIKADWQGKRPAIHADLTLPEVVVDAWLPKDASSPQAGRGSFISEALAEEKVLPPAEPWDNTPIDLAGLQAVDADLSLVIDRLHYQGLLVEKAPADIDLKAGKLRLKLPDWNIAKGVVNLQAALDASRPQTGWNLQATLANVESGILLKELAQVEKLSGKANASVQLSSQGRSMLQWMQGMGGKLSFRFNDGAIKGIDLAQIARNIKGAIDPTKRGDTGRQQTDFAELSADFTVHQGTAHTDNLLMLAPFARLTGTGDVYLPRKELRFEVTPKAVGSIKGQGGDAHASGLYVPFVVKGTFEQLAFYPRVGDLVKDVLKDPSKLKELKDDVKGIKNIKDGLKDMFGGF